MSGKSGSLSKAVIQHIQLHPEAFPELMDCFFDEDLMVCQRSAITVGKIVETRQAIIEPYIRKMLKAQSTPINSAIRRNVVRTFAWMDIPEKYRGEVFDLCFNYINDPKEAIAVRAFAMAICGKICSYYPELKEELLLVIQLHEEFGSPAFKSQARKVRRQLGNIERIK